MSRLLLCSVVLLATYVKQGGGRSDSPQSTSLDAFRACPRQQAECPGDCGPPAA